MSASRQLPATGSYPKGEDLVALEAKPRKRPVGRPQKRSVGRPPKTLNATGVSSEETSVEKTPAKKRIFPARKSPVRQSLARQAKIKTAMLRSEPVVVLPIIDYSDSESDSETGTDSTKEKSLSPQAMKNIASNIRSRAKRQTSRDSPIVEIIDEVVQLRPDKPSKRANEFSSDDDELESLHLPPTKSHSVDPANTIIALLFVLIELSVTLTLPLICNNKTCEFRLPCHEDLKTLKESLSLTIFLCITAFFIFNSIVSILTIGGNRRTVYCHEYNLNGLFALVVHLLALLTGEMYHIPVTQFVINNFLKFITASILFAFLLEVLLFVKSLYAREVTLVPEYKENSHVANFILGGHIHPRFAGIDVKFVIIRCCVIGSILIVLSFVYQSMDMISVLPATEINLTSKMLQMQIRPTLLVMTALTLTYYVEYFVYESGLLTTFEFRQVSWGFMKTLEYVTGTFIYCMMIKYVYDFNVELSVIELGVSTAIFLFGYTIYRDSNTQKNSFNENPYGSTYESIPTTKGRKLLFSGYWGIVRRQNYLGDIILTLSFVPFVWPSPALLVIAFIVANLVQREIVNN